MQFRDIGITFHNIFGLNDNWTPETFIVTTVLLF